MLETKTLVKICGITSKQQAIKIAELGVYAIGIISVEDSPRYISNKSRIEIFKTLESLFPKIERVTVFKNCPIDSMTKNSAGNLSETIIQLHGDEDIDYCRKIRKVFPSQKIWKAFRVKSKNDVDKIKTFENFVDAILLDSWNKETYGGSGQKINPTYLQNLNFSKPWWLAGGVSIDWIDEILHKIKPQGIDISSSVEITPGIKNLKKIDRIMKYLKENQ